MDKKILLFVLMLVLFSANVLAIGITPGRTTLDFKPGLQKNIEVIVINSQKTDIDLSVSVQGELKDSISLESRNFKMSASEEEKKIKFSVSLPQALTPGLHTADVVVTQHTSKLSSGGSANVGAELAVATQVSVYVPYPGKYLDAQIDVSGDEKTKNFAISMINRGMESINSVKAEIVIYDSAQKEIKRLQTNTIKLGASERGSISAKWDINAPEGRYTAKAVINYDGKEILAQKDFDVGEFLLDLLQIYVKDFKLGGIAKFNMVVQNKWNEPITKAYAEMRVFDKEMDTIADMKSATYDIPPGLKTEMVYYWDTKGISEGLYNANVILYYAGKKTQQDLKLDIGQEKIDVIGLGYVISSESSSGNSSLVTILAIVIGFLVLLNIAWFFVFRKKRKQK